MYNCVTSGRGRGVVGRRCDCCSSKSASRAAALYGGTCERYVRSFFTHFFWYSLPPSEEWQAHVSICARKMWVPVRHLQDTGRHVSMQSEKHTKRTSGRNVTCDHHTDALLGTNTCNMWGEGRDLAKWPLDTMGRTVTSWSHISYLLLTQLFWWQNINHILEGKKN